MVQGRNFNIWRRIKIRTVAGFSVLVLIPVILSGCATTGRLDEASDSPISEGHSVARLEDNQEGFIITEVPHMDEESRQDFQRALVMLDNHEYDQAIDILRRVIDRSPGVTAPYINIAIAYRRTGRQEQAEEHLKTALRLIPGHPVACNEYGLLCRQDGRFAEARAIYEESLSHFPEYYPVHRNLGILCDLYLNDPKCALAHYKIYSEAQPDDEQVKLWIAELQIRLERDQPDVE